MTLFLGFRKIKDKFQFTLTGEMDFKWEIKLQWHTYRAEHGEVRSCTVNNFLCPALLPCLSIYLNFVWNGEFFF